MSFDLLYRALLLLLPPGFRRAFGDQLVDEAHCVLAEAGGRARRAARWRILRDLGRAVLREWWDETNAAWAALRGGMGMSGRGMRTALRSLIRAPGFSIAVVLTLGLGIGANTMAFGLVDAYLLQTLPYEEPDEIISIWPSQNFSRELITAAAEIQGLEEAAGAGGATLTLVEGGDPIEVFATESTFNLFRMLGTRPAVGRDFLEEDAAPGAEPTVILSASLWSERFGSDPEVVGRLIDLGGEGASRRRVIGVMSPDHRALRGRSVRAWIPVTMDPTAGDWDNSYFMSGYGRLRDGVDAATSVDQVRAWAAAQRDRHPDWFSEEQVASAIPVSLPRITNEDRRQPLLIAFAAALLILMVACANVANLVLARTSGRGRELSVRAALGSGRGRAAGVVLNETILLGLAGAGLGLAISLVLGSFLSRLAPGLIPVDGIPLVGRPMLFALFLAGLTALLAGFGPALQAAAKDPAVALSGGRGSGTTRATLRLQTVLAAGQLGLATIGVASALLLGQSLLGLARVDPGFAPGEAVSFRLTVPAGDFPTDADVERFFRDATQAMNDVPGIAAAGFLSRRPMVGGMSRITVSPEGYDLVEGQPAPQVTHRLVTAGALEAMGTRLLQGRYLNEVDEVEGDPITGVINQAAADEFWPGENPVGKRFYGGGDRVWLTVVGVIDDVREDGLNAPVIPAIYIIHRDWAWRSMWAVATARPGATPDIQALKDAVWSVSPTVPISGERQFASVIQEALEPNRLLVILAGLAGGITLLLGGLGVYGVVAYGISRRIPELGLRAALGAGRGRILRDELGRISTIVMIGGAIGALGACRGLQSALYEVAAFNPAVLALALIALGGVGVVAAWLPARRAARIDPVQALRQE